MRPLLLHVEGFGSFRGATEISFADTDYFALVGPTGAGKSTIIDALCFALYGTVPRWGKENVIAHALAPSAAAGKVGLVFESGGRRYGVVRALVRDSKGTVRTKEARLDELAPGATGFDEVARPVAEGENVTTEVQRVTGLEYRFFTQCVVLPQGRFAEFLHAAPRERQDLLVQLLDADVYDRIRQRAAAEEEQARQAATFARNQLAKLSGATDEAEREARERAGSLRALADGIGADLELLRARDTEHQRTREALAALTDRITALRSLTMPPEVPTLAATAREAADAVTALEAEAATLAADEQAAEAALAGLGDRAAFVAALAALDALDRAERAAAAAHATAAETAARVPALAARLAEARDRLAAAETARDRLRDAHAGAGLAARLTAGDPCPVCLRPVTDPPSHGALSDLGTAERAVSVARGDADQARAEHGKAETSATMLADQAARLDADLAHHRAACAAALHPLRPYGLPTPTNPDGTTASGGASASGGVASPEGARPVGGAAPSGGAGLGSDAATPEDTAPSGGAVSSGGGRSVRGAVPVEGSRGPRGDVVRGFIEARLADMGKAEKVAAEARAAARGCRTRLEQARTRAVRAARQGEDAWRALEAARDRLLTLGGHAEAPPPVDRADLHHAWSDLIEWRNQAGIATRVVVDETERALAELAARRDAERAALLDRLTAHGVPVPGGGAGGPDQLAAAVAAAVTRSEAALERIREDRAKVAELTAEVTEHDQAAQVAHELDLRLRANAFERWLCAEALALLVATASDTLRELSDGQYELVLGSRSEIEVIDHAEAGMRRSARTLSGGETFQAALALALALSGTVARGLESIFLDEGFGTLDPATLDTVATTLERLASGQERMVGVVTHVPALAERVPVRFEVSRDTEGSHVRRVGP
ncbi:SMC family ATPase [Nonomuraea sp. NPDC023979]|uniref:SMC family ATPase n=1 Tax=Nonomuraea sp. NPDC023979 TaxID=3154796 RepID=UPI003410F0F2